MLSNLLQYFSNMISMLFMDFYSSSVRNSNMHNNYYIVFQLLRVLTYVHRL